MFSRSHSQQGAGWDSNPMGWLWNLCFLVNQVPTLFVTSSGKGLGWELLTAELGTQGGSVFCLLLKL